MPYKPADCKTCGKTFQTKQKVGYPRVYCYECNPPQKRAPRAYPPCTIEGCGRMQRAMGWCPGHYARWQKHGDPLAHIPMQDQSGKNKGRLCSVSGCEREAQSKTMCTPHYLRVKKHGDAMADKPIKTDLDNAGWFLDRHGYRMIRCPDPDHPNATGRGWIMEHRWVMIEHLGRPLIKGENVHHINGDRVDNRLQNLELWATMQPTGQRATQLLAYAREIIERYEPIEEKL